MSCIQCITKNDITDLRTILEDVKSNLYTWIDAKQQASEISDITFQGISTTSQPAIMSIGTFTYTNENINTITGDSSYIQVINDIING
jgi:hypothetical protein